MKYLKTALLFLGFTAFTSCNDELTIDPVGLLTDEQMNATPTVMAVENSVSSSYLLLSNTLNIMGNWDWTGGLVTNNDIILQDVASDDVKKPGFLILISRGWMNWIILPIRLQTAA